MPHGLRAPVVVAAALLAANSVAAADDPKAVEFFESKIRPVLVEHCLSCHSADAHKAGKLKGGLLLDSRAGWQKGGDTGPAIVPGDATKGTLLAALRFSGDLQMPPKGKLPAAVVADFEKWVKDGAVDPRQGAEAKAAGIDLEKGRQFWAFQPPARPAVPGAAKQHPVDAFVGAKLAEKGLKPNPQADKRTLIRRAYLGLTGLPPTPEEVEAFEKDTAADAWPKLVDKLLASPHYGERWARHWLDVARYAEDQAHTFAVKPKKFAYQYRDWVIKALNADMPYDQFVRLQIAGDLVPESTGDLFTRVAGLGFLGLGAEYYKNTAREQAIADELDDRVDTLTRGFLGLTVSCARCHDHKFDPIPTVDYYSVAGIFYGSNLTETPLAPPDVVKAYADAQAKVKQQEDAVAKWLTAASTAAARAAAKDTATYATVAWKVAAYRKAKAAHNADAMAKAAGLNRYLLDRWVKLIEAGPGGKSPAELKPLLEAMTFPAKLPGKPADLDVPAKVAGVAAEFQARLADVADQAALPRAGKNGKPKAPPAKGGDALAKAMFTDPAGPFAVPPADAEKVIASDADRATLAEMRAEVKKRQDASPPAPPTAAVLAGGGQGMPVYVRGNPANKGEAAPKGFLQVVSTGGASPGPSYTRLDLANAIASKDNPLTARVIVNRVWAWHFGRGLVDTPSNFGALGGRPTHPELLDWLAVGFMENGWSLKWLHRQILASAAYQRTSDPTPANASDAANVYLWRGTRRRLDVESWRDSLLAVAGTLDTTPFGPTFDLKDAGARRRTVYAKVSRHDLDGLLRLFDFPDANVTADRRNSTTVPQQQLFALNSEFMANQAKAFAARLEKAAATDGDRVTLAYRLAYGRPPEPRERAVGLAFLKTPPASDDKLTRWQQYAQALLAANELMYCD